MKNSKDTIGNRTRYLPICIAVPQPTAPPLTRIYLVHNSRFMMCCIYIYIYIQHIMKYIYIYCIYTHTHMYIQDVSGGIVNILGGGYMDYSE